jgi:predicted amidohydrolase YtcJ
MKSCSGPARSAPRLPLVVLLGLTVWAGCDGEPTPPEVTADLVLYAGRVIPVAPGGDEVEAVAVTDGRIVRVGLNDEVLGLAGSGTRRVDLEGRTVLPGIVDAHTHMFNDAWRLDTDLSGGQDSLLANGVTTTGDAFVNPEFLEEMRAFDQGGLLLVRTSLYLIYTDNCGALQGDWWQQHSPTREFGERLRIGGIKLFMDGGTCGRPALREEIAEGTGYGDLFLTADDVAVAIRAAESLGHQAIIHAMGDRAVEAAQDGIAQALDGRPNALRHRIDHNVVVGPDLVGRYRELGIQPVLFAPPMVFQSMVAEPGPCLTFLPNEYLEVALSNTRMLLDSVPDPPPAWHGDDPWVMSRSPFRDLFMMVTRIRRSDDGAIDCPPTAWQLATAITVEEGLRMMTLSAAWALFRETEVGSLEPGKLADFIVLPANPLSMPVEDLWDLRVDATYIGGEAVYCRETCPEDG